MTLSLSVKTVKTSNCKNKDLTPVYNKYYYAMITKRAHVSNWNKKSGYTSTVTWKAVCFSRFWFYYNCSCVRVMTPCTTFSFYVIISHSVKTICNFSDLWIIYSPHCFNLAGPCSQHRWTPSPVLQPIFYYSYSTFYLVFIFVFCDVPTMS